MSIRKYRIKSTSWVPITAAGQDANVWIDQNKKGTGTLILSRSDSGAPSLKNGFVLYEPHGNTDVYRHLAAGSEDILYARTTKNRNEVQILVDASYFMSLDLDGFISDDNSSKTPLAAGGLFTGVEVDVEQYGSVFISVYSDVASAEDGLKIEQSTDGINWYFNDVYTIPADTGKNFSINLHAKCLRIRYENGSNPQTIFDLQTKILVQPKFSSHRIKDDIKNDDDAELVIAALKVQTNDENIYTNVDVNNPFPTDGDSVYAKDLIIDLSDQGSFEITTEPTADKRRILSSMVSDVHLEKKDDTATNPKQITLTFKRPVLTNSFGIDSGPLGDFSNVKITVFQGQFSAVVIDESTDGTKYTIRLFDIAPLKFSKMLIEFYTTDTVTIGLVGIFKNIEVAARLQALNDAGFVEDISCTNQGNLKVALQEYGDTPSIDAFDRLRVSAPYTIFDSKQLHDKQPLFWDESTGGSGSSTHNSVNAAVEMDVTASATDFVIRQTKQRFNYQPGKGQLAFMTFRCPDVEGITARVGMFDGQGANYLTPKNGIFFECGDALSWNIAKNGSITEAITQANWNFDKLDGTGFSGKTLDMDATQIIIIDYEWLGVGRVRVGFVIDGLIYYCHYFNHSNDSSFTSVYMSTPNLPLRYSIESDGNNAAQLDHICGTVMSEGGLEETGILRSIDTGTTHLDANTADTTYAVIGIRLKSAYLDVTVLPKFLSMIAETNDGFRWSLLLNPTISGTFTYTDVTNSALQKALGVTANDITDEGFVIDSGYVPAGAVQSGAEVSREIITALRLGSKIDGTQDEIVLAVTPLTAGADIQASLTVRELL